MQADEAKLLLGFPPNSHPSSSQDLKIDDHYDHQLPSEWGMLKVKAAYKTKVWDTHPDRFPPHQKSSAEHQFKLISEAYSCLRCGPGQENLYRASYSHVVRAGVPRAYGGRGSRVLVGLPFVLIILGTVALGASNATRAYKRQKEAYPSHNPFLP